MKSVIFRTFRFSNFGTHLLVVDGDDYLHVFDLPELTQTYHNSTKPFPRATFYSPKGSEYIAAADSCGVQLLDPDREFAPVAKSIELSITPRALVACGPLLFLAGYDSSKKSRLFRLEFKADKLIVTARNNSASGSVITALAVSTDVIAAPTIEGDVLLFGKNCGRIRRIEGVHGFAISSAVCIPGFVVTGGLDNAVILTPLTASRKVPKWVIFGLIILILAVIFRFVLRK
jgi:hypothetical protein